jgi:hypothetical protein
MRVYGIDFTSRPRRAKPITCLECTLTDRRLRAVKRVLPARLHEFRGLVR